MHIRRIGFIAFIMAVGSLFGVRLSAEGTLRGRVYDYKNNPLPTAQISLKGPQGVVRTNTDRSGNYWFYGLTPGHYEVVFSSKGWASGVIDCLWVRSGYTLTIDWAMNDRYDSVIARYCGMKLIDKTSSSTGLYISRDMLEKFYR